MLLTDEVLASFLVRAFVAQVRSARVGLVSDAELAKLTWHNAVRVLRDTEAAARTAAGQGRGPKLA